MRKGSRRFTKKSSAKDFAKMVDGKLKDLRKIPGAKSKFKVTYDRDYVKKLPMSAFEQQTHYEDDLLDLEIAGVADFGYDLYDQIHGDDAY